MMGRQALLTILCWTALHRSSGKAVQAPKSVGLVDNVSEESAPPPYRNIPVGVYSYASASPYAAYSFQVPQFVAPNFNQIVPLNQERILAQSSNNYLKDSYGQRFVAPQAYAYKATLQPQFVPLQKLPAHLSQPLVAAAPNARYGQATHFFGAPFGLANVQAISQQNGNPFGASQPLLYAHNQANGQPAAQQQSTSNNNVYANAHSRYSQFWNAPKVQVQQEEPKISASDQNENQEIVQSLPLVHAPKQTTITSFTNGKKTVVNLITKPPVPLLDLTLLEPLKFDNPIVPQVQHFLPKIHSVTYKTLPELSQKNHQKVITIKRKTTKKTKKQKKPKVVNDEVEVHHTPAINHELSYEVNSPNYKETISEKKVSYNKETTTKPIVISYVKKTEMKPVTYSYGKHVQKKPVHYNYVHNSNDPAQLKQAYLDENKEKTKHLIYHFSPEEQSEEQSPNLESVEIFEEENPNESASLELPPQQEEIIQHVKPQKEHQPQHHELERQKPQQHQPQISQTDPAQHQKHNELQEDEKEEHQPYEPPEQRQFDPREYHKYEPQQYQRHEPQQYQKYEPQQHQNYESENHQEHEPQHHQKYEPQQHQKYKAKNHQEYEPQQHQKYEPQQHQKYEAENHQKYEPQQYQKYEPQHQKYEAQNHQKYEPQQHQKYEIQHHQKHDTQQQKYEAPRHQNYEPQQHQKYEAEQHQKYEAQHQQKHEPHKQKYEPQEHQQYKPQQHQTYEQHNQSPKTLEQQQRKQHIPQQQIHNHAQHELAEEAYNEPNQNFRDEPAPEDREVAYYQNSKENIESELREEVYSPKPKNAYVESRQESPEPVVYKSSPQQEEKQYEAPVPEYEEDIIILPANKPHAHAVENSNRGANNKHISHPEPQSEQVQYEYDPNSYYSTPPASQEKSNRIIIKDDHPRPKEVAYKPNNELIAEMVKKQEESEDDFEQAYKDAAYGFQAYDEPIRNTAREKEIYNPANYGVPRYQNDFDGEKSPLKQYEPEGDEYPSQMRANYKDTIEKTNDEYYTDYAASKPQSLVDGRKKKEEYYNDYDEHKPQKYYAKDDSDKQQSEKYIVGPAYSYAGAPQQKFEKFTSRISPLDQYHYAKEAPIDSSAFGTGTYSSKMQFLEPQYQYGFEPIRVSRLLDRELAGMASDHSPETVKKIYKENYYIEKSTTSKRTS